MTLRKSANAPETQERKPLAYREEISRPSRRIPAPPRTPLRARGVEGTTADPITPGGERPFVRVASEDELRGDGDRVHVQLLDADGAPRHVSLINHDGEVFALDSLCYHAGGPLAAGDIEDVGGSPRLSCPWHLYKVTLGTGEKLYGSTKLDDDGVTLVPDGVKSVGERQRTHETELREDGWYVRLRLDGVLESDRFANKRVPGISGARVVRVDQPVIAA